MRYLSVCWGIEAASAAWEPLGWQCAGVSEIEPFPRAVLEHRLGVVPVDDYHRHSEGQNFTPLFGDFTRIEAHHVGPVDLLVGGTPCQSFSIAGKRAGLDDPRGHLSLEFLALARRVRARWILWENVPGVLSHDEGRTFGTFVGFVGECGYRWAYRVLDAQYCRVGRFGRAVPQRRRRVFLVGYSGTAAINPAAVLFDRESLRGHPAPRREAGQGIAPTLAARTRGGGGLGTDFECDGGLIASERPVAGTVSSKWAKGSGGPSGDECQNLVAHALRGEGFDASEDGTGRGTPIVPVQHPVAIQERAVADNPAAGPDGKGWRADRPAYTLEARSTVQAVALQDVRGMDKAQNGRGWNDDGSAYTVDALATQGVAIAFPAEMSGTQCAASENLAPALSVKHTTAIAFSAKDSGGDAAEGVSPTLRAGGHSGSHANAGVMPAVAFDMRGREGGAMPEGPHDTANIRAASGGSSRSYAASAMWGVRRVTPTECARLQGFPDDWARIPWRGKSADQCPDGPQYKAYGNSMAVNVMCWIGERIAQVDAAGDAS